MNFKKGILVKWLSIIFSIFTISFVVLFPTFNLHLSGDDYQSFWRYKEYYNGMIPGEWNDAKILLTDYGPQDLSMSFIQRHFGYEPRNYYIASYILRLLAAFSFLPVVYYFTKSNAAAFLSSLFFSITITGLESTDWVFNMPVYIAIAFLNLFLYTYFKSIARQDIKIILLSGFLFAGTILAMPIRMLFMPGVLIFSEMYWILVNRNKSTIIWSSTRIIMFLTIIFVIFSSGNIGNSLTGYGGQTDTSSITKIEQYFSGVRKAIANEQYRILLYPIGQLGTIIFPNNILLPTRENISNTKTVIYFLIPSIIALIVGLKILKTSYTSLTQKYIDKIALLSIVWAVICFYMFKVYAEYPLQSSHFVPMLIGGYFIIALIMILISHKANSKFLYFILLPVAIVFLSFAQYWLRDSHMIQATNGRYLIIPAVGTALLVGSIVGFAKRKSPIVFLISILILVHMYASHKYVKHLSIVRDREVTTLIRNSIPNVFTREKLENPIVFYFEPRNSEILHHALLFGFPVIMATQYEFMNIFNIVYTDNWAEVVSAYIDGEGVRRFGARVEPVALENIYSYKLDGLKLVDVSDEIRVRLQNINK
jgi:hypothetical protein